MFLWHITGLGTPTNLGFTASVTFPSITGFTEKPGPTHKHLPPAACAWFPVHCEPTLEGGLF